MRIYFVLLATLLLGACSSARPPLAHGSSSMPALQFTDARTVEEIRKLRPQARYPIKIAVVMSNKRRVTHEERAIIEQLGTNLKQIGFARSVELVPEFLAPSCGYQSPSDCLVTEARKSGARMGADAILYLHDDWDSDSYVNPLSVLDLTIVGMWLAPGHHRDIYTVCEAALFDIDNGYLYAVAEGQGEHKVVRPFVYVENNTGLEDARAMALNDVANRLYAVSQEQMGKTAAAGK